MFVCMDVLYIKFKSFQDEKTVPQLGLGKNYFIN
jgi:hypothetical protein